MIGQWNVTDSTGWMLAVYNIQIRDINKHKNLSTVGTLLVWYYRSTDYYYWSNTDKWVMPTLGTVLAVNRILTLAISRHRNLIDSWCSTGLILPQYWLLLLVKYQQVSYANLWYSTGCKQNPNTGYQPT